MRQTVIFFLIAVSLLGLVSSSKSSKHLEHKFLRLRSPQHGNQNTQQGQRYYHLPSATTTTKVPTEPQPQPKPEPKPEPEPEATNSENNDALTTQKQDATQAPQEQSWKDKIFTTKVKIGLIIFLIVVAVIAICCCFLARIVLKEKKKSEENIPFYNPAMGMFCKQMNLILLAECVLRWLGFIDDKQTRQRKKQQAKEQKKMQKMNKKNKGMMPEPEQSRMVRQDDYASSGQRGPLASRGGWEEISDPKSAKNIKSSKCSLCKSGNPNCATDCSSKCAFHLQCLINYKNEKAKNPPQPSGKSFFKSSSSKSKNQGKCPSCQSNYFNNNVRFFCQKCWKKSTELTMEQGNVYGSILDVKETIDSIGGEKCETCRKKWF